MKTFYYDVERGYFVNSAGGVIGIVPTLVYGEQARWKFYLKTATGAVYSLADVTELTAAAGVAGGETVAATTEGITVDVTAGCVTVPMNCLTTQFQAATQGKPNGVYGFYELTGYDAAQGKTLYIRFNVLLNEVVNPDITTIPGLADQILAVVSSGGYVTSDGVTKAVDAAVTSGGFLTSGAAFTTTVGPYTVALTSGGGLRVTGSNGESMVISGGTATLAGGDEANVTAASHVGIYASTEVAISADTVPLSGHVTVNGAPAATRLVTSTDTVTTSAAIPVLSGGTAYIYTQPLTSLTVASVANTTAEDRLRFTLASGGSVTIPASCGVCPSGFTFEGGKSYLVAVMGGNVVAAEYAPGV